MLKRMLEAIFANETYVMRTYDVFRRLQILFDEFDARPTNFIAYTVATDVKASESLNKIKQEDI